MNATQRKNIAAIRTKLENFSNNEAFVAVSAAHAAIEDARQAYYAACDDAASFLDDLRQDIESEQEDEQGKFDNLPEGLQASDNGQNIEQAVDTLQNAIDALQTAIDLLRDDTRNIPESDEDEEVTDEISNATACLDEIA